MVPKSMKSRNHFKDSAVECASFMGMRGRCCTYFECDLHHGQHVDTGRLPVSGDKFSDLRRLQTAHCVEFVSGEANFGSKDLSERCTQSRKTAKPFYKSGLHNINNKAVPLKKKKEFQLFDFPTT